MELNLFNKAIKKGAKYIISKKKLKNLKINQ